MQINLLYLIKKTIIEFKENYGTIASDSQYRQMVFAFDFPKEWLKAFEIAVQPLGVERSLNQPGELWRLF